MFLLRGGTGGEDPRSEIRVYMFDQIESLAPINIADIVLECHREDEHKGHVEGYYRACEFEHVELRYFDSEFMGE